MDKKLMPDEIGDKPVTAQSLAATINSIRKTIVTEENAGQNLYLNVTKVNIVEDCPDIQVDTLEQDTTCHTKMW